MKNNEFIPVCTTFLNGSELKYVSDCIRTGWISSAGKYVAEFENSFANYCGAKYGVAVTNGTAALHLALAALGIKKGDEVIIPSFTMIACAFAVCYTGAKPVFVDADKDTWNIDPKKIEAKITKRTKAIMPVHIFGNPCDILAIKRIAAKHKLHIVEDCAEAHGAIYKGKKVGSFSSAAAFSFFANKNLTTGEGGMVITGSRELYEKCKYFRNMCYPSSGAGRVYAHNDIGFNYRITNLQAAIGLAQTEKADYYKNLRIKNNKLYRKYLAGTRGITFQKVQKNAESACWMNAILVAPNKYGKTKTELADFLKANNVDTRALFTGMHRQKCLKDFGCNMKGDYTITDALTENGLYLPSSSNLKEQAIRHICNLIKGFSS